MDEIKKFCVFGLPVSHSLSPLIHKEFAKQQGISIQYKLIEPDTEEHFETHAQSFFSKKDMVLMLQFLLKKKHMSLRVHMIVLPWNVNLLIRFF